MVENLDQTPKKTPPSKPVKKKKQTLIAEKSAELESVESDLVQQLSALKQKYPPRIVKTIPVNKSNARFLHPNPLAANKQQQNHNNIILGQQQRQEKERRQEEQQRQADEEEQHRIRAQNANQQQFHQAPLNRQNPPMPMAVPNNYVERE